jgi:hypothetical protein
MLLEEAAAAIIMIRAQDEACHLLATMAATDALFFLACALPPLCTAV